MKKNRNNKIYAYLYMYKWRDGEISSNSRKIMEIEE